MANKNVLRINLGWETPERQYEELGEDILDGISEERCSTGTRIEDLHGAAKFNAILKNIGDGSMREGFEKICKFFYLHGIIKEKYELNQPLVIQLER